MVRFLIRVVKKLNGMGMQYRDCDLRHLEAAG